MNIVSLLFQDQADDRPHEEKNEVAVHYNVDNKQDEERDLKLLDYVNLAGVLLTMTFAIITAFNLWKSTLCITAVIGACTTYTVFFRQHKLEQFRKKWGR